MFNRLYSEGFDELVSLTTAPPVGFTQEIGMFHPHDETVYHYIELVHPAWSDSVGYEYQNIVVTCDECGANLLGRQVANRSYWPEILAEGLSQTCDLCCVDCLPDALKEDWLSLALLERAASQIWATVAEYCKR